MSEAQYILRNIPYRRCVVFEPVENKDNLCRCGYSWESHHPESQRRRLHHGESWSADRHLQAVYEADTFGQIEFTSTKEKLANYVRVDSKLVEGDNMRHLTELLLKYWKLPVPNLIITVTGGARSFKVNQLLSRKFRQGIVRAAQSTGAWIVTGGTYTGVMMHTGKAVRDCAIQGTGLSDIVCIGVVPWGVIEGREKLIGEIGKGKCEADGNKARYEALKIPESEQTNPPRTFLDPNHTHFILVDDGTNGRFGTEINLRAELEKRIAQMSPSGDKSVKVPVCCVLVQGGPGSLETACAAVRIGTPVVILKDSGMAADVIASSFLGTTGEEVEETGPDGELSKRLVTKMTDAMRKKICDQLRRDMLIKEADINKRLKQVEDCIRYRDLISIFRLDKSDASVDFDLAILLALFKAKKDQVKTQLKLSLAWNRVDIVESYIFASNHRWPHSFFNDVAHTAFVNNRVEFLRLFMQSGLSLKNFLSIAELARLYHEIPKHCFLRSILSSRETQGTSRDIGYYPHRDFLCLFHIGKLLDNAFGDLLGHPYYEDDRYNWVETGRLLELAEKLTIDDAMLAPFPRVARRDGVQLSRPGSRLSNRSLRVENVRIQALNGRVAPNSRSRGKKLHDKVRRWRLELSEEDERNNYAEVLDFKNQRRVTAVMRGGKKLESALSQSHFDDPAFDLFIYCILQNRSEMALVCYEEVREAIPAALTAVKIYRYMATLVDDIEAQTEYENQASTFETIAFDVLGVCFEENPVEAQSLLVRKVALLNGRTCLSIAKAAGAIRFISHPCCQKLFNRLWYGKIHGGSKKSNLPLIITSLFIPPVLYALEYEGVTKHKQADDPIDLDATLEKPSAVPASSSKPIGLKTETFFDERPCLAPIAYFYNSPYVIFIHTIMSYILFLILMAYDLLIVYPTMGVDWGNNWAEILLVIYVGSLFVEQIHSALNSGSGSKRYLAYEHITNSWNLLEIFAICFFLLAMILGNLSDVTSETTDAGRIFYAFAYMLFFARVLHWYAIEKHLGPKVVMVGRMLADLVTFMGILLIFVFAWGVAQYALLFPQAPQQWTLLRDVLVLPFWQMFTQFYLNIIQQQPFDVTNPPDCTDDPTLYSNYTMLRCVDPTGQWVVPILLAVFVMLTNLLLFNLLIAMFAFTFSDVQTETDHYWNNQRFELISEFIYKPPLVPPFIVISHLFILFKVIHRARNGVKYTHCRVTNMFKAKFDDREDAQKVAWMAANKDEYLKRERVRDSGSTDQQIREMNQKMKETTLEMAKLAVVPVEKVEKIMPYSVKLQHKIKTMPSDNVIREALEREKQAEDSANYGIYEELMRIGENADLTTQMLQSILKLVDTISLQMPYASGSGGVPGRTLLLDRVRSARGVNASARGLLVHKNARSPVYPVLGVDRCPIPNNKVQWDAQFKRYEPILCTADEETYRDNFVAWDSDLLALSEEERASFSFNQFDVRSRCNRTASTFYEVESGIPINPFGRTGTIGRGMLPRWGPNYALLCAVVRRKMQQVDGDLRPVESHERPVLEVLLQFDASTQQLSVPRSLFESCDRDVLSGMLVKLRDKLEGQETLPIAKREKFINRLQQCFSRRGKMMYEGYLDNELNTDNAWIEAQCVAIFVPDELGQALSEIDSHKWIEVNSGESHLADEENLRRILSRVADRFGAAF